MSPQVNFVPGQTDGRRKAFLEWTSINLSSKLSLRSGGYVNYYKSVHHPISTLPDGIGAPRQFSKQISILSFQLSVQKCSLLGQSEGKKKASFGVCKKGGHSLRLPSLGCYKRWKLSPFVKFKIILLLLCFLIRLSYK